MLCSKGSSTQCSVQPPVVGWGRNSGEGGREAQEGGHIGILMADSHFVWQKPTQHGKAIILQLKNKFKKKKQNLRKKTPGQQTKRKKKERKHWGCGMGLLVSERKLFPLTCPSDVVSVGPPPHPAQNQVQAGRVGGFPVMSWAPVTLFKAEVPIL